MLRYRPGERPIRPCPDDPGHPGPRRSNRRRSALDARSVREDQRGGIEELRRVHRTGDALTQLGQVEVRPAKGSVGRVRHAATQFPVTFGCVGAALGRAVAGGGVTVTTGAVAQPATSVAVSAVIDRMERIRVGVVQRWSGRFHFSYVQWSAPAAPCQGQLRSRAVWQRAAAVVCSSMGEREPAWHALSPYDAVFELHQEPHLLVRRFASPVTTPDTCARRADWGASGIALPRLSTAHEDLRTCMVRVWKCPSGKATRPVEASRPAEQVANG